MPVYDPDCYECPFYNGICDECNCPENDSCPDIEESKANNEWLDNRENQSFPVGSYEFDYGDEND